MSRSLWILLCVVLASCGGSVPSERTAVISFTGCGDGFAGEVAAIVVGPGLALTVAHGVARADALEVRWSDTTYQGRVVGFSSTADLALVSAPGLEGDPVTVGAPAAGSDVWMVGGLTTGRSALVVEDAPTIRIEEVLGSERVERAGLKLIGNAADGDSGAGVFDESDVLVGVVFAVSDDASGEVWATASSEITALLAAGDEEWRCDPARSRLVQPGQG